MGPVSISFAALHHSHIQLESSLPAYGLARLEFASLVSHEFGASEAIARSPYVVVALPLCVVYREQASPRQLPILHKSDRH